VKPLLPIVLLSLLLMVFGLAAPHARAAVVTSLDADTIDEMESVTLTVRVSGTMSADSGQYWLIASRPGPVN